MEHHKRHERVWRLLRPLVRLVMHLLFNYTAPVYDPAGPYIVLSNHETDFDPLLAAVAFRHQMYFVSSEHIYRQGFLSRALWWLQEPIARQKGGSAAGTVKNILRTLHEGGSVAIFPEGNRTWDGVTASFPASTGKMVRASGASLITFHLTGGYFGSPRWSGSSIRKGRMSGEIVHIYTPEELKAMTAAEVNDHIRADLYEDAYARQDQEQIVFRAKKPAEHLESLLFTCPVCGAMHRMHSSGRDFTCTACGMHAVFNDKGYFEGSSLPFNTVKAWKSWQDDRIGELCAAAGEEPIFTDPGYRLSRIETARSSQVLAEGDLALYRDRLILPGGKVIPLSEIGGMAMRGAFVLFIGLKDGTSYEVRPDGIRCSLKYLEACSRLGCTRELGL